MFNEPIIEELDLSEIENNIELKIDNKEVYICSNCESEGPFDTKQIHVCPFCLKKNTIKIKETK